MADLPITILSMDVRHMNGTGSFDQHHFNLVVQIKSKTADTHSSAKATRIIKCLLIKNHNTFDVVCS